MTDDVTHLRALLADAIARAEKAEALTERAEVAFRAAILRAGKAEDELAAIADAMHGPTMQPLTERVRGYVEECDRLNATIGALTAWTHKYGVELKPPGADTYGEGKRDAKNEVAAILRGAK